MSAFARGLQAGSETARGWVGTYEAARKRKEEEELRASLKKAAQTELPSVTEQAIPTAEQTARAQSYTQAIAAQDAATFGLSSPEDMQRYAPAAVSPEQRVLTQRAPSTAEQLQARTEAMASAYEQAGRPEEAIRLRSAAQQQKASALQIEEAEERLRRDKANFAATSELATRMADGPLSITDIYKIAADNKADPSVVVRAAADRLDLTDKQAKVMTTELITNIRKASTNPQSFGELLKKSFDPDPTDNIVPELRQVGNGYQVFYGEKQLSPMFQSTKEMPALFQLAEYYAGQISGNPLAVAVQMATLEAKRAQTRETEAKIAALGPAATRDQIRIDLAQAEQFRKQLSDIDRELANYIAGSPQHSALTAQRNQTAAALRDINASILSQRQPSALPTGGAGAAPGGVEAARAQALTGKRPDGKPYTAQDKKDYEKTFGEAFPEAPKKEGGGPKGGRQEAIPAGASPQEIKVMFNDARRGGARGSAYLRQKLEANEFNVRDRLEAEKILGIR